MSFGAEVLPPAERVRILHERLTNLRAGKGEFRPCGRSMAVKECARCLAEAEAALQKGVN